MYIVGTIIFIWLVFGLIGYRDVKKNGERKIKDNAFDENCWLDLLQKGWEQLKQGDYSDAAESFDKSKDLNPGEAGTHAHIIEAKLGKAECLFKLGKIAQAKKEFKSAKESFRSSEITWLKSKFNKVEDLLK